MQPTSVRRGVALVLLAALAAGILPRSVSAGTPAPTDRVVLADRFRTLEEATAAGSLDRAVSEKLRAKGSVDALVTFDADPVLAGATAVAGNGPDRSRKIIASIAPAFRGMKERALTAAGRGAALLRDYETLATVFVRIRSASALLRLLSAEGVTGVREDRLHKRALAESLALVDQPEAAAAGYKGSNTSVAVLDTGVDYTRTAFGSCSAPGGTCKVAFARDFAPEDNLRDADPQLHGTNVSGIVLGVAPDAKVLGLDVFRAEGAYTSDINAAMNWVVANHATYRIRAMNLSLGSTEYRTGTCWHSPSAPGFASARAVGVLPVVAAGNDAYDSTGFHNGIGDPACAPGALSVGAVYDGDISPYTFGCGDRTTAADRVTCFSQTGPNLGMLAPGACITAADVGEGDCYGGTSQAAPHVAGAAAVLAAKKPAATPTQVEAALKGSGPSITDSRPTPSVTKRRLEVDAAVQALLAQPPSVSWEPPLHVTRQGTWSFGSSLSRTTSYLHTVYTDGNPSYLMVGHRRSMNGGASWSPTVRLNPSTEHGEWASSASAGSYVYAAWTSLANPASSTASRVVWFRRNTNQGRPTYWTARKQITPSAGRVDQASIAASGAYVYVVWTDSATGTIKFRRSTDRGVTWSSPVNVGSTTNSDFYGRTGLQTIASAGGNVAIAWMANPHGALKAKISRNYGASFPSTPTSLDTDSMDGASVAALGSRVAFAWTDLNSYGSGAARLRVWEAGAWKTTAPRTVSAASFSPSGFYKLGYDPAVALVGTSGVGVAWSACRRPDCSDSATSLLGIDLLYRESANNGGTWKPQVIVGNSAETNLRRVHDGADIEWASATKRYIAYNGRTTDFSTQMYQRNATGPL